MANIVLMPQLGISEESAVLSQWHVKAGDKIRVGAKLFTLETGKASFDVESEFGGTVLELLCEAGDELPIQTPVCAIGAPGEKYEVPVTDKIAKPAQPAGTADPAVRVADIPAPPTPSGILKASPRARMAAEQSGVSLEKIPPTGPEGRIIERDVNEYLKNGRPVEIPAETPAAAAQTAQPAAAYTDEPISKTRKAIAAAMRGSLANSAQLTLSSSFDAAEILSFRKNAKEGKLPGLEGVSINDMLLFAVSRTLPDFPALNAHFLGDKLRCFAAVDLAFACDTKKGLLVPVIRSAEKLSLLAISKKAKELAAACQDGTVAPADIQGGSFTVSNLGALGIESFTPVLNPPQTGILGVCAPVLRPREVGGEIKYYTAIGLSLTFDHQALDGAPAAKFLKALCVNLENFGLLLAK